MNVEINAEGYDLTDDMRAHIHDRIGGLEEFLDKLDRGHVTVSWEGGKREQTRIRARVSGPGVQFESSGTDWKPIAAIDKARSKLESQLKAAHNKRISKRTRNHG